MLLYKQYLEKHGVDSNQIIYILSEDLRYFKLRKMEKLYEYLQDKIIPEKRMYFLLDEIKLVENWQEVINSLRLRELNDVTVTGSNAQILSGELSTRIAGRYVEIKVYPLSFKEFIDWNYGKDVSERNKV